MHAFMVYFLVVVCDDVIDDVVHDDDGYDVAVVWCGHCRYIPPNSKKTDTKSKPKNISST